MIVVDLGCAEHDGEASVGPLIERFKPNRFYGFDPHPGTAEMFVNIAASPSVHLDLRAEAAWIYDGTIDYLQAGLRSRVGEGEPVPCFDLARFILELPEDELVVKMDVEGAEKQLLEHLIANDADKRIALLLIEWHDHRDFVESFDRDDLISRLHCPMETWH